MEQKESQIIMKKKKFPYEEPEFLIFKVLDDIITFSGGDNQPDFESETEDNDWGMGILPF